MLIIVRPDPSLLVKPLTAARGLRDVGGLGRADAVVCRDEHISEMPIAVMRCRRLPSLRVTRRPRREIGVDRSLYNVVNETSYEREDELSVTRKVEEYGLR